MDNHSFNNTAIDLSLRSVNSPKFHHVPPSLVRPIARLPWTITWYQSAWSNNNRANSVTFSEKVRQADLHPLDVGEEDTKFSTSHSRNISLGQFENSAEGVQGQPGSDCTTKEKKNEVDPTLIAAVLDVACCDGPVVFERVSNPNFALTVEHNEPNPTPPIVGGECQTKTMERQQLALKTYVCIYCNQSFKSLFCYQKHKKRHLNPVSVDITATHNNNAPSRGHSDNTKTKDLNVQFFPCKKCGSKFPSYYFVHKHRKVCHVMDSS